MPDASREIQLGAPGRAIAGVDEVGRGPLAGPVTAAAVILTEPLLRAEFAGRIDDSKKLSRAQRLTMAEALQGCCIWAVGWATAAEIDAVNILQASHLAMRRAVTALPRRADHALVDGKFVPPELPCPADALVGGDGLSLTIAAASILAKTARDRAMTALDRAFPGYGWWRNMGYGTAEHRQAITELGLTPYHRKTFSPVSRQLALGGACS